MGDFYFRMRPSTICPDATLKLILEAEKKFNPSSLYAGYRKRRIVIDHYRNSLSWQDSSIEAIGNNISKEIQTNENILDILGIPKFSWGRTEITCVAFGDGCFFKEHTDALSSKHIQRRLSWVYYLHLEPKPFEGGELVLRKEGKEVAVTPEHGTIIIFDPKVKHEVLPVSINEKKFKNSRFTITGFVYEAPTFAGIVKEFVFFRILSPIARSQLGKQLRKLLR